MKKTLFTALSLALLLLCVEAALRVAAALLAHREAAAAARGRPGSSDGAAASAAGAGDRPAILCYGGSFTRGDGVFPHQAYPRRLEELLARDGRLFRVVNMARLGGTNMAVVAERIERDISFYRPKLVVININHRDMRLKPRGGGPWLSRLGDTVRSAAGTWAAKSRLARLVCEYARDDGSPTPRSLADAGLADLEEKELGEALAREENDAARLRLAELQAQRGAFGEAEKNVNAVLARADAPDVRLTAGRLSHARGDPRAAEAHFRRALALEDGERSRLALADFYTAQGRPADAERVLAEGSRDSRALRVALGKIHRDLKNFDRAEEHFLHAVSVDKPAAIDLVRLAYLYAEQGELERADDYVRKAVAAGGEGIDPVLDLIQMRRQYGQDVSDRFVLDPDPFRRDLAAVLDACRRHAVKAVLENAGIVQRTGPHEAALQAIARGTAVRYGAPFLDIQAAYEAHPEKARLDGKEKHFSPDGYLWQAQTIYGAIKEAL